MAEKTLLGGLVDRLYGYDFFISYAHGDWPVHEKQRVHFPRSLEAALKARGFRVFLDESDHVAGEPLDDATRRRVGMSRQMVLVAGPHAAGSHWVGQEIDAALRTGRPVIVFDPFGTFAGLSPQHPMRVRLGERIDIRRKDRTDEELLEAATAGIAQSAAVRTVERRRLRFFAWAAAAGALVAAAATLQSLRESVARTVIADQARWEQAVKAGASGNFGAAAALLREVQTDDFLVGWRSLALTTLVQPAPHWTSDERLIGVDEKRRKLALWHSTSGLRIVGMDDKQSVALDWTTSPGDPAPEPVAWTQAVFSVDGEALLVTFADGSSAVWNAVDGGLPVRQWPDRNVKASPDRSLLVAYSYDPQRPSAQLLRFDRTVGILDTAPLAINSRVPIAWPPDGGILFSPGLPGEGLVKWKPKHHEVLLAEGFWPFEFAHASDGSWLVVPRGPRGGGPGGLEIRAFDGKPAMVVSTPAANVHDLLVAKNNRCILARSADKGLNLLTPASRSQRRLIAPSALNCESGWRGWSCKAEMAPDCSQVVLRRESASDRDPIAFAVYLAGTDDWHYHEGFAVLRHGGRMRLSGQVDGVIFSPNGGHIALNLGSGQAALWNVKDASLSLVLDGMGQIDSGRQNGPIRLQAFSPDGQSLHGLAGPRRDVHIWPLTRLNEPVRLGPVTVDATVVAAGAAEFVTANGWGTAVWQSPPRQETKVGDERQVFSGSLDPQGQHAFLIYHPQGAVQSRFREAQLFERGSGKPIGSVRVAAGEDRSRLLDDSKKLLSIGLDLCAITAVDSNRTAAVPQKEFERKRCAAAASGTRLVSWDARTIEVWDTRRLQAPLRVFEIGADERAEAGALDPEGRFVAVAIGGARRLPSLRIWDLESPGVPPRNLRLPRRLYGIGRLAIDASANRFGLVAGVSAASLLEKRALFVDASGPEVRMLELEGVSAMAEHMAFDATQKYLMLHTISPQNGLVIWETGGSEWPVLWLNHFPAQLHDAQFGPGADQVTILYGTGRMQTLPISPEGVRQALDQRKAACLTAMDRKILMRSSAAEADRETQKCHTDTQRPWTLARRLNAIGALGLVTTSR